MQRSEKSKVKSPRQTVKSIFLRNIENVLVGFLTDRRQENQFSLVNMLLSIVMRVQVGIRDRTVQGLNFTVPGETYSELSGLPTVELFRVKNGPL